MHADEGPSTRLQTVTEITPATDIDVSEASIVVEIPQETEVASQMSLSKRKHFVLSLLFRV